MTHRFFPRLFPILGCCALLPLLLGGCPPTTVPLPGAPAVSDEERAASIEQIGQVLASIELDGDPAKTEQIAALLRAQSVFADVRVDDNNVIARFHDGEVYIVFNSRPPGARVNDRTRLKIADRNGAIAGAGRARSIKPDDDRRSDLIGESRLPESKLAVLINSMGTDYCDVTPTLGPWLTDAGYTVKMLSGTVEELRTGVKDAGVIYYSGHGNYLGEDDLDVDYDEVGFPLTIHQKGHFTLWTRDQVTVEYIKAHRKEFADGFLSYGTAGNDREGGNGDCLDRTGTKQITATHVLITELFVRKYWRCKKGGLIYLDACHSAEAGVSPLPEICTLQGANEVGASAVLGWTAKTLDGYSTPTALFFFDRILGSNSYEPIRSPRQRPFSTTEVMAAMQGISRNGLPMDTSASYKELYRTDPPPPPATPPVYAKLVVAFADGVGDVVLRPAIKSMSVAESVSPRLRLTGQFSDTPGDVTVGGTPASIVSWTPTQIETSIASNASGPVVVSTAERQSPARRLTQWNLNLRRLFMDFPTQQSTNCPSCFWEGNLQYSFRGDTAGVRVLPEGPVSPPSFTGGASSGNITVTNAGGTYSIGQGTSITLVPNPDDGAAFIGTCVGFLPTEDNNYLGACFFLQGSENRVLFSPTLSALGVIRNYHGGVYDGEVHPMQVLYSGNQIGNELELQLSPNFNIAAGQKMTGPNSYFEWDAAVATSPAEPTDAR